MKKYLRRGDRAFTTGAFLVWTGDKFIFDGIEDDTFFEGENINWDKKDQPYIELDDNLKGGEK